MRDRQHPQHGSRFNRIWFVLIAIRSMVVVAAVTIPQVILISLGRVSDPKTRRASLPALIWARVILTGVYRCSVCLGALEWT